MNTKGAAPVEMSQEVRDISSRVKGFYDCLCLLCEALKDAAKDPRASRGVKEFMAGFTEGMKRDQAEFVRIYAESLLEGGEIQFVKVVTPKAGTPH